MAGRQARTARYRTSWPTRRSFRREHSLAAARARGQSPNAPHTGPPILESTTNPNNLGRGYTVRVRKKPKPSSLAELKRHRSCDSCDAERSNACHRSARPCYEWRRLTVSPCFRNSAHGTATEDKVLSDAHSARLTPAARSRPSLSLFARPGDQAPTVQTDPAPPLGRHQAELQSSSTGRPSPSARTTDAHSMTRAIWAGPSRVTRHASPVSHPRIYPLGPTRIPR